MYLPHSVPLSPPHVAVWFGKSGKQYDFAVARARPMWLGHPAVYVLVRQEGGGWVPLFVGRAEAAEPQLGGAVSPHVEAWEQAMAMGMSHVHLRFEAFAETVGAAEVSDLIAALQPPLNVRAGSIIENARAGEGSTRTPASVAAPVQDEAWMGAAPPAAPGRRGGWSAGLSWRPKLLPLPKLVPASGLWSLPKLSPLSRLSWRPKLPPLPKRPRLPRLASIRRLSLLRRLSSPRPRAGARAVAVSAGPPAVPLGVGEDIAIRTPTLASTSADPVATCAPPLAVAVDEVSVGALEAGGEFGQAPSPVEPAAMPEALAAATLRARLGFEGEDVVVLFAGELAHAMGADLVVDAMATVHRDPVPVRLIFAGDGPLRGELESRAWHGGYAHCCRFLGDVCTADFDEVLAASDAVILPARTPQDGGFAAAAMAAGKPVLTTHQARIDAVVHGENGLVTYDNVGSMVWVLREVVAYLARRKAPPALAA